MAFAATLAPTAGPAVPLTPKRAASRASFLHGLVHWAAKKPSGVFLSQPQPDGSLADITWAQAELEVRRMGGYLRSLGLPPGSNIGLVGKNSAHWLLADLAILAAGHVSVPLYPTLGADNFAFVLEHAEVPLLFVGRLDAEPWAAMRAALPPSVTTIGLPLGVEHGGLTWDAACAAAAPLRSIPEPDPDALATIVYTSGSTGRPKGVMHSHRSMMAGSDCSSRVFHFSKNERLFSYLPLAHVAERAIVEAAALYYGSHIWFLDSLETFVTDIARARPTLFFSVPRLWMKFYTGVNEALPPRKQRLLFAIPIVSGMVKRKILRKLGLDRVRLALTGSAPLAPSVTAWYRNLGLDLIEGYGMSENFAASHVGRRGQIVPGYVGSPLPGVSCRIGEDGEILVKSPGQMLGYYKEPELTASTMTPDGYFRTGDRGEVDERGRLRITGRVKELFKTSKGKYVAPAPIEQKLCHHPFLEAACVTGPGRAQPFGLLLLAEPSLRAATASEAARAASTRELEALLDGVNAELEPHERLEFLAVVGDRWTIESGLLTPTMKIRRDALEARYLPHAAGWSAAGRIVWLS